MLKDNHWIILVPYPSTRFGDLEDGGVILVNSAVYLWGKVTIAKEIIKFIKMSE